MTFDEVLAAANTLLTDAENNTILRERYPGPNGARRLAENLVTVFSKGYPNGQIVRGPVTFVQADPNAPAISVVPYPGPVPGLPGSVAVPPTSGPIGGGGGLDPNTVIYPIIVNEAGKGKTFPFTMIGQVQSGSGQSYVVRCWMLDPLTSPPLGDFPCTQQQIAPTETIPAGTICTVVCFVNDDNEITSMQLTVPVFLE